ncbi:MAG: AbrB family transcriptional regulator [Pseudomonadota bacterium]
MTGIDIRFFSTFLTILVGFAGGTIAYVLGAPLPWMIGALICVGAIAIGGFGWRGITVSMPPQVRLVMVPIIGVMLGSAFTPEVVAQIPGWLPSLFSVAAFVMLATACVYPLYRRVFGYDRPTAYFAAVPGGLLEMAMLAEEQKGDMRTVSAIHFLRIVFAVVTIPLVLRVFFGPVGSAAGVNLDDGTKVLTIWDGGLLLAAAISGFWLARLLRIPAAPISGPVMVSALFHATGWTDAAPPGVLVIVAQVVMGSALGARFSGYDRTELARAFGAALLAGVVMMSLTLAIALLARMLLAKPFLEMVLSLAPGGLVEMALIALSLQIGIAFVTAHHLIRILISVLIMPSLYRATIGRGQDR